MAGNARVATLIRELELQPHPEGGHFREFYRSASTVSPKDERGSRAALTTIYFLLESGQHSRWHRVASDEVWHFYEGVPLELFWLTADGDARRERLGPLGVDTHPVHVVPAGAWQAARPSGAYALVGCTVGPGFAFEDFAMLDGDSAEARRLRDAFPDLHGLI